MIITDPELKACKWAEQELDLYERSIGGGLGSVERERRRNYYRQQWFDAARELNELNGSSVFRDAMSEWMP